jgi:zinc protease
MNLQTRLRPAKSVLPLFLLALALTVAGDSARAQSSSGPEPKREQLLNGLRVLLWPRPTEQNVTLKLRIHSGAAFDLAGKAGTMALLGDTLFPDPAISEFFTGELGGRLEVRTDYDGINITMTGRATEFERIVDLLRGALINPPPPAETLLKLRDARALLAREMSAAPATIADRAVAARLFGDYPYGRPVAGDLGSVSRLERGDLLFARERFLNPDNATLVVLGGVDERRALRALRQLLGAWRKGDRTVPATFRQPAAPDARTMIVDLPGAETAEVRLALRGLARSDADYPAAMFLELLARDRWQAALPELARSAFFVRHETHTLPGIFMMGASVRNPAAASALAAARNVLRSLAATPPAATEFERVRNEALATFNKQAEEPASLADMWLDVETYRLKPVGDQARALSLITPADAQRVAARLFRETPVVAVVVGSASQLRADLESAGRIEVSGEAAVPKATPTPTPAAAPAKPHH